MSKPNLITRKTAMKPGGVLRPAAFAKNTVIQPSSARIPFRDLKHTFEAQLIRAAFGMTGGTIAAAARCLGVADSDLLWILRNRQPELLKRVRDV